MNIFFQTDLGWRIAFYKIVKSIVTCDTKVNYASDTIKGNEFQ